MDLLDHLLIVLAGIPSTFQHPTQLYCSPQLPLQPLRPHFSYKPHPLYMFTYCSHLSNAATDIWPNGDLFRQVPLYFSFIEQELDKKQRRPWWSENVARTFEQSIFNEIHTMHTVVNRIQRMIQSSIRN